ncbi:MAG: alpha/beta fold hydrolase [Deltaproteobacteria bacterium]|nr:alpha/beta fold hydrolase [Deltaproteobacteria bacterium]
MPIADVNGIKLHYRFDGPENGEVIMFSNSLASDLTMWDFQITPFSKAGYRILRYDSRGHGQSSAPSGAYTMEILTSDVVGLMDYLGLKQVHFCGLSLGGMVGQMLGALQGERLISLILCDTSSNMTQPEIWDERIAMVRRTGMEGLVDATIDRWFTKAGQERLKTKVEDTRQVILNTAIDGYCGCGIAIRDMDLREIIKGISVRTLIIVGEQDQGTPVSAAEFIHGKIGSSVLKVIPNAAHFVNVNRHIFLTIPCWNSCAAEEIRLNLSDGVHETKQRS